MLRDLDVERETEDDLEIWSGTFEDKLEIMPNSSEEGSGEDSISKSGSCTIANLDAALDDLSLDELYSLGSSLSSILLEKI